MGFVVHAVDDGVKTTISSAFPKPYPVAVSEANARLIAASPDLLAACQDALVILGYKSEEHPIVAEVVEKIRAAVSKASS